MITDLTTRPIDGNKCTISTTDKQGRKHQATINSLGCGLVDYTVDDLNVVCGFEDKSKDWFTNIFSGIAVFPWPNRLEDGTYEFEDITYYSAINEPDKNTQLHSFSQFYDFDLIQKQDNEATFGLRLPATLSYPFDIYTEITYRFAEVGGTMRLNIIAEAKNLGQNNAPWGFCLHPWFNIRGEFTDASLQVDANKVVEINERALPTGPKDVCEVPVSGKFDMLNGRTFTSSSDFDHAFVDLNFGSDTYANCVLTGGDGHITKVGAAAPYMSFQICTLTEQNRHGTQNTVALEPSTCYANAFKTGDNLITLTPGELFSADCFIEFC